MAGFRTPNPLGLHNPEKSIDDGTLARSWSPVPGPLGLASSIELNLGHAKALVIFFGGANDSIHKNMYRVYADYENSANHEKKYLPWTEDKAAKILIANQLVNVDLASHICLIGHSYGGDTAMDVARDLNLVDLDIQLVVTLDPVSNQLVVTVDPVLNLINEPIELPSHVEKWINVWVETKGSWRPDNIVAELGGHWGMEPNATENMFCEGASHAQANEMFKKVKNDVQFFEYLTHVDLQWRKDKLNLYETYLQKLLRE
jgi:Chlorophyllase enzyme